MKKGILLLFLCANMAVMLHAQASKGNKSLDAKDFQGAKAAFEAALAADPNDAAAFLGMARYYAIPTNPGLNLDLAIENLGMAEKNYLNSDPKTKAKFEKEGVTQLSLSERRDRTEAAILEIAKKANTIAAYNEFIRRFPDSKVARPATTYRDNLAYKEAYAKATEETWNEFLKDYPQSERVPEATTLRNKVAAASAMEKNTEESYLAFVKNYPEALEKPQMQQRLNAVAFENAKAINTTRAYQDYINRFPDSVFLSQAQERRDALEALEGND